MCDSLVIVSGDLVVADHLEVFVLVLVVALPVLFAPLLAARVHHLAASVVLVVLEILCAKDEVVLGLFAMALVQVVMGEGVGDAARR